MNLLASKDPIAYQMVSAVNPAPDASKQVYNGPYVSGEEYELLLDAERRMDTAWNNIQEDLED
jgi:hypothetical protein